MTPAKLGGDLANIQAMIDAGGQIMVGNIAPIKNAAVAHDGTKTVAMLKRKPKESIPDLLLRLDAAILAANSSSQRIDEINKPDSDSTYELGKR